MTVVFQASHDEPVSAHLEHWLHVVGETFGPAHVRPPRGANLPEHLVVGDVGAARVSEMRIAWQPSTTESCQAARTPRLIRQSDPDPDQCRVDLVVRGRMAVEQAGLESALGPGDLAVVDLSRPARWATTVQEGVSLQFPAALLPLREDDVARISGARIPGDRGTGAVAFSFARQLVSRLDDFDAADGARLGSTMVDLVAAALAPRLEPEAGLPRRSRRQALLSTIYAFIERRLERCRRDLLDPALRRQPVSAIAARWGLTDPATFSRLFRPAYGVPPAEYRRLMAGPPA